MVCQKINILYVLKLVSPPLQELEISASTPHAYLDHGIVVSYNVMVRMDARQRRPENPTLLTKEATEWTVLGKTRTRDQ